MCIDSSNSAICQWWCGWKLPDRKIACAQLIHCDAYRFPYAPMECELFSVVLSWNFHHGNHIGDTDSDVQDSHCFFSYSQPSQIISPGGGMQLNANETNNKLWDITKSHSHWSLAAIHNNCLLMRLFTNTQSKSAKLYQIRNKDKKIKLEIDHFKGQWEYVKAAIQ